MESKPTSKFTLKYLIWKLNKLNSNPDLYFRENYNVPNGYKCGFQLMKRKDGRKYEIFEFNYVYLAGIDIYAEIDFVMNPFIEWCNHKIYNLKMESYVEVLNTCNSILTNVRTEKLQELINSV